MVCGAPQISANVVKVVNAARDAPYNGVKPSTTYRPRAISHRDYCQGIAVDSVLTLASEHLRNYGLEFAITDSRDVNSCTTDRCGYFEHICRKTCGDNVIDCAY